eukprot:gnl/TRDRNA2_/TRDRNA2_84333_c0_seq2.p1 gnl/TRDRNA2_/TRDRNA2_84333_c0~~gnl/TRDRNA2_/TRDRNA2_84333_c0_seq2.p1  ORF type:complete len:130 (+),score=14.13 gnl/TRDRNA2_/TRDRNA2_84333_c0_seq2:45-434(+)
MIHALAQADVEHSVRIIPILCGLFMCTNLRAESLTNEAGFPSHWCETFMEVGMWSFVIHLLLLLVRGALTKKPTKNATTNGRATEATECTWWVSVALLMMTYSCAIVVVVGFCSMDRETSLVRVSSAVH